MSMSECLAHQAKKEELCCAEQPLPLWDPSGTLAPSKSDPAPLWLKVLSAIVQACSSKNLAKSLHKSSTTNCTIFYISPTKFVVHNGWRLQSLVKHSFEQGHGETKCPQGIPPESTYALVQRGHF